MLTKNVTQAVIKTFVEVLRVQKEETARMETLEKFDQVFGVSVPGWEQRFIEELREFDDTDATIRSVEAFIAKYHVYGEDGSLKYERIRVGNGHHSLTIVYDASAPAGQEFKVEEHPNIDNMSLQELREYYEELEDAINGLEDQEPAQEDTEEYEKWEDEYSDIESLMDEIEERIEEMLKENNEEENE